MNIIFVHLIYCRCKVPGYNMTLDMVRLVKVDSGKRCFIM